MQRIALHKALSHKARGTKGSLFAPSQWVQFQQLKSKCELFVSVNIKLPQAWPYSGWEWGIWLC